VKAVVLVALAAAVLAGAAAGGTPKKPWLWQCEQIHLEQAKDACYVRLLLLDINRSGDPATELPRIDARAKAQPTSLYCTQRPLNDESRHDDLLKVANS